MAITNRLKEIRMLQNIRQSDLAAAVGVSRKTIVNIECGNRNPSVELALRIAACLDTTVEELFLISE